MALVQPVLITADEYRMLPETGPQYQLIEGELYMAPAPRLYHQDICRNIEEILYPYLRRTSLGVLYHAPVDVYLNAYNVYQPDLLFIRQDHRGIIKEDGVHGAPDLVIEILSPRTAQLDKVAKRKTYATAGVQEYWLVNPETKSVEVFRFQENTEQPIATLEAQGVVTSSFFPGLELSLAEIFKR